MPRFILLEVLNLFVSSAIKKADKSVYSLSADARYNISFQQMPGYLPPCPNRPVLMAVCGGNLSPDTRHEYRQSPPHPYSLLMTAIADTGFSIVFETAGIFRIDADFRQDYKLKSISITVLRLHAAGCQP